MIKDITQTHREKDIVSHVRNWLKRNGKFEKFPVDIDDTKAVFARVDFGNWLVDCPFCPGAEPCDFANPRFFCLSCLNAEANGKWIIVVIPKPEFRIEIETSLEGLPKPLQNWRLT